MRDQIRDVVSALLWEISAVKLSTGEPFTLASGNRSPLYVDCRVIISSPWARGVVSSCAHWLYEAGKIEADCIAGGETAGIPFAAWLAERLAKPFVYVRKRPKGYGTASQIEGDLPAGRRVLLCEDLITDGKSKLVFVDGIQQAGCEVRDCLVVFDREQGGRALLAQRGVALHALSDLTGLLRFVRNAGYLADDAASSVDEYLRDPAAWHAARGYQYSAGEK
jgi:orotate phosphoribosyltransferase